MKSAIVITAALLTVLALGGIPALLIVGVFAAFCLVVPAFFAWTHDA